MADDTNDPIEQGPRWPGRDGFEFKKAMVQQHFRLEAARFAANCIGKPWDRDAFELGLQDLASLTLERFKPTFKALPVDVHIERNLGSSEVWEVVGDGPRHPPRDSVKYQQHPGLYRAEQAELWRMLRDSVQSELEGLDQAYGHSASPAKFHPGADATSGAKGHLLVASGEPLARDPESGLATPSSTHGGAPPRRTPDLKTSRDRIELVNTLARELALIKQETQHHCRVTGLKQKYPQFKLWTIIEDSQIQELVDGADFMPKAYAESLVLTKYGITSRQTLKKDRKKLRKAKVNRTL